MSRRSPAAAVRVACVAFLGVTACGRADTVSQAATSPTSPPLAERGALAPRDAGPREPGLLRFVAIGDTGRGDAAQARVADALAKKCAVSGCDFVQLLGDNIYTSGVTSTTDPQWQSHFERPYAKVDLPFWVVLGNHDYGGGGLGNESDKAGHQVEYSRVSAKWRLPARFWRRVENDVELVGLDTNAAVYRQAAAQRAEVDAWLTSSKATWRLAFGHHPYKSNGPHGDAGSYDPGKNNGLDGGRGFKEFFDGAVCGKVDVYFAGHDHSIQVLQPDCGGTALVVSGAGAEATTLPGSNPTYHQTLALGFVWVEVRGRSLRLEVVDETGATRFERALTK